MNKKVLFISYDGMTDPLGQSQVIPYLAGLSRKGYSITILSFEKKEKMLQQGAFIRDLLHQHQIQWETLRFHRSPRILSKAWDVRLMKRAAHRLQKKNRYDLIHCRSYIAAGVGLALKKKTGSKFLFDMRGFWADEKAEGGNWNKNSFFWKKVYDHYKALEKKLIREADHIISLTQAGKEEILRWDFYDPRVPVTVIPCCVDNALFSLTSAPDRKKAREQLNIQANAFVLGYLGSIGAWYMLDEMLNFFALLKKRYPHAIFLFITNSAHGTIYRKLAANGLSKADLRILTVNYKEVPVAAKAADFFISFIKPVYSKIASSPTKYGEILSLGIPLILNDIGDSGLIIKKCQGGIVINAFDPGTFEGVIERLDALKKADPLQIRNMSLEVYALDRGVEKYSVVYGSLVNN